MKQDEECKHIWIVTVDENNFPENIMCSKCKTVSILVFHDLNEAEEDR